MRHVLVAALLVTVALSVSATAASAATGHWVCTADGIKSWTSDGGATDASGWTYSGDKSVYKDGGHCTKK
ncbi:MAG TPA: hypothetical protein VMU08_10965 [Rhizomicrobium sp.]|nr:hypothetical protein [Rhizomicrobium sp.]